MFVKSINQFQNLLGYLKCLAGKTISCKSESMANHQTIIIERCIKPEFICDNVSDCHNGPKNISDEYGCPETMHDEMHNENYILCEGGTDLRRLPKSHVCDFQVDCLNGEDEADCGESFVLPNIRNMFLLQKLSLILDLE